MKSHQGKEDITGRIKIFFILVIGVIIVDRISKALVNEYLTRDIKIIPNLFSIDYVVNTGAGFGLLQGKTVLLSIISSIFIILILVYVKSIIKEKYYWAAALVLGGAVANLFDRLFYGFVIDFIEISSFPVFNLADTAISIGAAALLFYLVKDSFKDKKE